MMLKLFQFRLRSIPIDIWYGWFAIIDNAMRWLTVITKKRVTKVNYWRYSWFWEGLSIMSEPDYYGYVGSPGTVHRLLFELYYSVDEVNRALSYPEFLNRTLDLMNESQLVQGKDRIYFSSKVR